MARFGIIKSDAKVFINDKIRFDATKSFLTPDETLHATVNAEFSFDDGATWINCSTNKYVDYIYTTAGTKSVKLRLTSTTGNTIFTHSIVVLDIATASLFSNDSDLYKHESEIDNLLPRKWSSWNLVHLEVQKILIDWLDESGIVKIDNSKYAVADLMDIEQVRQFATYKALELIYGSAHNVPGDLYEGKRDKYAKLANTQLSRSNLALDADGDGEQGQYEKTDLHSVTLVRE